MTVLYFIGIAVVAYIGLVIILFLLQSRLIYFPEKQIMMTPEDVGLPYESVSVKTVDAVCLSGWFIPSQNDRGTVLMCHGNAGNISHRLDWIRIFHSLRVNVFLFDYRGYGQSEGKTSEQGTYRDVEAVWNYLIVSKRIPPENIIIHGVSLGGAIAAYAAQKFKPAGLILESTFISVPDLAQKIYPYVPVRLLSRFEYSTRKYLKQVSVPVLIVHSQNDEMIPYEHCEALFKAAHKPKELLIISGSHNEGFIVSQNEYTAGLNSFISKYLQKKQ